MSRMYMKIHVHISIASERWLKESAGWVWFQSMVQKKRIKGGREREEGDGLLDYLGYECQRTRKRKSCIKYAAVQIRMPEEGRRRGGPHSHSLPSLFQTVSSPCAMAASLFPNLSPLAPIWHFLLAISLPPNFSRTRFSWHVNPLALVGSPSHYGRQRLPLHRSVTLQLVLTHMHKRIQICVLMSRQAHSHAHQPECLCSWDHPFTAAYSDNKSDNISTSHKYSKFIFSLPTSLGKKN